MYQGISFAIRLFERNLKRETNLKEISHLALKATRSISCFRLIAFEFGLLFDA